MRCVEVALPVPLFRTFSYGVPEDVAWPIAPGTRVLVPFRNRAEIGICLGESTPPEGVKLKAIRAVVDTTPALTDALVQFLAGGGGQEYRQARTARASGLTPY